jgi:hypothetical protein
VRASASSSPPPYFVDVEHSNVVVVRSAHDGSQRALLRAPIAWSQAAEPLQEAVAGSGDGMVFVAALADDPPTGRRCSGSA